MSIVVENLSKRYGATTVLDQVSLEVAEGELFVLLGASGSGKSTILRMIAGLSTPDSGRVVLNGRDVTALPPQERGTGFVFQNYSIFRHMTVAANVEFGLRIRKMPRRDRRRRQEELLDLVGLSGLGDRYAHELSGGQQQRVALARALAYQPSVLLLDEPFGALDVKIRSHLRRSFKEIKKQLGVTTILVTHDQDEAFELADRIGVMSRGRVLEIGTGEELYRRPQSLFVATFLGAGTVLVGRAEKGKARFGALALDIPADAPHDDGTPVRCLFRPEEAVVSADKPADGVAVLGQGVVREQSFGGAVRRVRVALPRIAGVRQLAPVVPFGDDAILVDATVPSEVVLDGKDVWIGLRSWSILREPVTRVLIADRGAGSREALDLGRQLSADIGAVPIVFGVADAGQAADAMRAGLEKRRQEAGITDGEVRLRHGGDVVGQVLAELGESLYAVAVLAADDGRSGTRRVLGPTLRGVLERSEQPILIAKGPARKIARILVCTAGGEPGQTCVRVGGRLARLLQAHVTLLHVVRGPGPVPAYVQRQLDRAATRLRAMDLAVRVSTPGERSVLRGILAASVEDGADLVVLGRHGPQYRSIFGLDDLTRKVVSGAPVPVLVVPAEEA